MATRQLGIEQARAALPSIVADASGGKISVLTRHGKPCAAIVPVEMALARRTKGLVGLRGAAKGLWTAEESPKALRQEWD